MQFTKKIPLVEKFLQKKTTGDETTEELYIGDVNKEGLADSVDTAILTKYINSQQSVTTTASSYIYSKACPSGKKLVGSKCLKK